MRPRLDPHKLGRRARYVRVWCKEVTVVSVPRDTLALQQLHQLGGWIRGPRHGRARLHLQVRWGLAHSCINGRRLVGMASWSANTRCCALGVMSSYGHSYSGFLSSVSTYIAAAHEEAAAVSGTEVRPLICPCDPHSDVTHFPPPLGLQERGVLPRTKLVCGVGEAVRWRRGTD